MTERGTTAMLCGIRSIGVAVLVAVVAVNAWYPLTGPAVVSVTPGPSSTAVSFALLGAAVRGRRVCGGIAGAITSICGRGTCAPARCGHAMTPSDSRNTAV